ncbi:hypothetical protein NOF55_00015 [Rhizobiaceae bacterium BDR2-2]|uniref:Uncharacterized protein n=1 Tax=Ectorhizobium quercum TaxID=2965071 RepID=A0AAE3MV50_9HYPH|nr:hypothetical protein [Ectorhizobium quercum]MCX8995488.1 hypothetical protein [Ectorhizobium quercum]
MDWKTRIIVRPTTRSGTFPAMAATKIVSDVVSSSRANVTKRAKTRSDGIRAS